MTDNVDTQVDTGDANVNTQVDTDDVNVNPVVPQAGNRGLGRKKGSKNKSTLLKEVLNNDFEEQLQARFSKVIHVVLDQAVDGCRQSQKMILDRVIPTVHAESDKDDKNKFSGGVTIVIGSLEDQTAITVSPDTIDAEYEEL